jgi:hypothetical protein
MANSANDSTAYQTRMVVPNIAFVTANGVRRGGLLAGVTLPVELQDCALAARSFPLKRLQSGDHFRTDTRPLQPVRHRTKSPRFFRDGGVEDAEK